MTEIDAVRCDSCKKTSFDYMVEGWIIIKGGFAKYKGRNKDGCAETEIFMSSDRTKHFCSWKCLMKYGKEGW